MSSYPTTRVDAVGPSKHLSWSELACHDGTPYPAEWRHDRAVTLAREFEAIREALGVPLLVLSAYRTPEWNRRIGGAAKSQHLQGRALDLVPVKGTTVAQLYKAALARAQAPGSKLRGLGKYRGFVHIDVRPTTRLARW